MPVQTPPTANILADIEKNESLPREQNGKNGSFHSHSLAALILAYRTDPDSPYRKLRYGTKEHYNTLCKRLADDMGHLPLSDIKARQLLHWHEGIAEAGHVSMGHALVGMIRTLVNFGATILEQPECERLSGMLHKMRFKMAKPRNERLTAAQAVLIRQEAHKRGKPSIALAQAIQFECMLRQKDVIGEWVPDDEPGVGHVFDGGWKWMRGIIWEEISDDFVLTHVTSKRQKEITVDLKLSPMVMEELHYAIGLNSEGGVQRSKFPAIGPVIFCETTMIPWIAGEYRRHWRKIARAVGIPDAVRSMDSRAGAISEATDAGADLEHVRHAATHSDIAMTMKYSRGAESKIAEVQKRRIEHRSKAS